MKNSTFQKKIFPLPSSLIPLALSLIALTFITCCKDKDKPQPDPNGLPAKTHEGKNTFGCMINGAPFVAKTSFSIGGATALSGQFDESTKLLQLQGSREDSDEHIESIKINVYITQNIGSNTMWVNSDSF